MKRVLLPLLLLIALGGIAVAETELANFTQEGRATWGTIIDGMQAAHPSLPIGSTPTIRNLATGKEITVTVNRRIPVFSTGPVIDISADAAQAIGLEPGGFVKVYFPSLAATSAREQEPQFSSHGVHITIHNHVIPRSAFPAWMEQRSVGTTGVAPPVQPEIRVIPDLPDPTSDRIYRLQVGAWSDMDDASVAFRQLRGSGFNTTQEYSQGVYRVYAFGVPAADVSFVVQQLGSMGFREINISE